MWSYLIAPFAWLMQGLYDLLFNNYALALIAYALIVKILLFPLSMKQQKNSLQMVRMRPMQEALQKKYGSNQERYNMELQKLYQREGYNPMSSCGPMLIQLPLIFIIYSVVRHPLTYVAYGELFTKNTMQKVYDLALSVKDHLPKAMDKVMETIAKDPSKLSQISNYELQIQNAAEKAGEAVNIGGNKLFGVIDLSATPSDDLWSWMILIPIVAAVTGYLVTWLSQKLNGLTQDPQTQNGCSGKMMNYMMPLMSLYFCYTLNCALGLYWIIGNILSVGQTLILHKMYDPKKVLAEVEEKLAREKEQKKEKRSAAAAKKAAAMAATKKKNKNK